MFDKIRLFAARGTFFLVVAIGLGFGLLIAGVAAILGLLMVIAFRIAMIGAERQVRGAPTDHVPVRTSGSGPAGEPA
ncbi:MAG TPA: hypothetical protein PLI43_20670 [Albidovulum sp.]|uniref:hypothetical protein n=1 Tax=Albidovulum sp. TaxID=1872424 RepID=UPI002C501716|nr:hypothetical protein [Albidovulum sp.]